MLDCESNRLTSSDAEPEGVTVELRVVLADGVPVLLCVGVGNCVSEVDNVGVRLCVLVDVRDCD